MEPLERVGQHMGRDCMNDLLSCQGAHALVTGASGGLGAHFAGLMVAAGAAVTITARREQALAIQLKHLQQTTDRAQALCMDVTDQASVDLAFDKAESAFGPVDVLINNAGITVTKRALDLTNDDFDPVMDTNVKGAWIAAQACARRLVAAKRSGTIINIASILGERVAGGVLAYATAKAGLVQLTKALALEWARHNIRVNALAPGYVETDINRDFMASDAGQRIIQRVPQRRLGQMSDLDGPLLLLASDAGRFMTGAVIPVDGGHLVSSL